MQGWGVSADTLWGLHWITRAAEGGEPAAQFYLGRVYHTGNGVPHDHRRALEWYALAARRGHPQAQYQLGLMYDAGYGVPRDVVRAHAWLTVAASVGDDTAQAGRDLTARQLPPAALAEAERLARLLRERIESASRRPGTAP